MTAAAPTDAARRDPLYVDIIQRAVDTEGIDGNTAADVWNPTVLPIIIGLVANEHGTVVTDTRRDALVAALLDDDADMRTALYHLGVEDL